VIRAISFTHIYIIVKKLCCFICDSQIAVNDRSETRYSPKLKIVVPNKPNILFDGFVNITPKKYDVKLALKNAFREPVTADG